MAETAPQPLDHGLDHWCDRRLARSCVYHPSPGKLERATGSRCRAGPPTSECCVPAPPVLEFDADGNLVGHFGGPADGYDWPSSNHGITADPKTISGSVATGAMTPTCSCSTAMVSFSSSLASPGPPRGQLHRRRAGLGRQQSRQRKFWPRRRGCVPRQDQPKLSSRRLFEQACCCARHRYRGVQAVLGRLW